MALYLNLSGRKMGHKFPYFLLEMWRFCVEGDNFGLCRDASGERCDEGKTLGTLLLTRLATVLH